MSNFEYTVTTNKPFADMVEAVEKKTVEMGFRVLHTHDIAATRLKAHPMGIKQVPIALFESLVDQNPRKCFRLVRHCVYD